MSRWASIICSSIALVLLGIAGFTAGIAFKECSGEIVPPVSPHCVMLYTVDAWAALSGAGLTVLLMVVHLIVAVKKHTWGWLITLLVEPLLCFLCYAWLYSSGSGDGITLGIFFTLIGLPNLLFGISVLKPPRGELGASPSMEGPSR